MKKILIRILVLFLIFVGSVAGFAYIMDEETIIQTEDMKKATLPLVYMRNQDTDMNPLHGYVEPMEALTIRDTLTPISTDRAISVHIQTYGANVQDIYFEVMTIDGSQSLENTKVTDIQVDGEDITAKFTLASKIRMNQEYVLKIQLKSDGKDVYYYTRLVQQDSLHTKEYLDFVNMFSENCLNKNADALAVYLEPEYDVEQTNLSYMDIHTTPEQLEWGNLNPQIYYKSIPAIKELNETTATITQQYLISAADEDGNVELYTVNEYFRLRYADEVVMLLDFERTTDEVFDPDNGVITDSGIDLGITQNDISFASDSNHNYFAFEQSGELWSYDVQSGKMAQIFTFRQKGDSDYRDIYGEHDIRVLNVSAGGNVYFIVAGYMNRGRHEGESGVALYYYDASSGTVDEKLFVDTNRSYDLLRKDVEELAYITEDQSTFYMLLDGSIYQINLATMEMSTLMDGLKLGCVEGSASGQHFAYLKENDPYNSSTVAMMNLDTGKVNEITCAGSERIRMLGYLGESLVYGVADEADIDSSEEGTELFPMKQVNIVNENGEPQKEYAQTGYYVTGGEISDRLLTMTRVQKSGNDWVETSEDHIIDNVADETGIGLTTQVTDRKKTEVVLLIGAGMISQTPKVVRSSMVTETVSHTVSIPYQEDTEEVYYVYAKGELAGMYEHANTAIVKADELLGVVVNQNHQYIWERGNRATESTIPLSSIDQIILSGTMDEAALAQQLPDKMVLNLAGCNMDEILYFISEGNPVLADTTDGIRILNGYDQWGNISFYEPGAEDTYLLSDEDSLALFEKSGNIFIGFLDKYKE